MRHISNLIPLMLVLTFLGCNDATTEEFLTGIDSSSNQNKPKSVLDFGAMGDGFHDDTKSIQKALQVDDKSLIYFPNGTYLISSTIILNEVDILGESKEKTIFKMVDPDSDALKVEGEGLKITNLQIVGGRDGILVQSSRNINIESCSINSQSSRGIAIQDSEDFCLRSLCINSVVNQGIDIVFSSYGSIKDCRIDSALHGIQWWGGEATEPGPQGLRDLTISRNFVKNVSGGGIWGGKGERVIVTSNNVEECGDVGIDFEKCYHGVISNNTVRNAKHGGIATFAGSQYLVISSNLIDMEEGYGPGIRFFGPDKDHDHNINGNIIHTWDSDGINSESFVLTNSSIQANVIRIDIHARGIAVSGEGNLIQNNIVQIGG